MSKMRLDAGDELSKKLCKQHNLEAAREDNSLNLNKLGSLFDAINDSLM